MKKYFLRLIAAGLLLCCLFSAVGCGDEPDSSFVSSAVSSEDVTSEATYESIPFTLEFCEYDSTEDPSPVFYSTVQGFSAALVRTATELQKGSAFDQVHPERSDAFNQYIATCDDAFFEANVLLVLRIKYSTDLYYSRVNSLLLSGKGDWGADMIVDYSDISGAKVRFTTGEKHVEIYPIGPDGEIASEPITVEEEEEKEEEGGCFILLKIDRSLVEDIDEIIPQRHTEEWSMSLSKSDDIWIDGIASD